MARDHDENLDDSQADNLDDSRTDNLDRSLPEDNFNRSRVRIRKKKKPPRVTRRKVSYCPNTSSTSFNRSNRRSSEPRNSAASRQYKKINEQLAQTLNYVKVELNHAKNELLVVKGEKLALQTENATLRGQVDPQAMEQEVQRRLFESIGPVKDCLNAALDNVVGLSDNLTQGLRLTTATSRMSLNRQSGSSVALNRNSSIGGSVASASSFRMRNATNFPPPSSETPNRTLPKSMVSPMVAGHTIKRPKIQLNRIAMQGGIGGIFVGENPVEEAPAQPDQTAEEEEDDEDEVEEESADEEQEEEIITQSPDRPRRNRFNLTIIGEESRIEESPLPASQPMERLNESDEDDGVQVLSGNVIHHSDVSLLHTPQNQPAGPSPSSSGRRSRTSVGRDLRISTEDAEQDVSIRRKSRTADSQRVSGMRQRLLSTPASPSLARTSVGGKPSRTSTGVAPRNASSGAMRSPAGSSTSGLSNTPLGRLSRSPYVDVMKTARHPHVLLSDLVISRHPAALGATSSQSPSPLQSRPSSSPVVMDNDNGDIEEEEQGGNNVFNMSNIPADPSDSFLERMCEENPLEGPSWLFATIKKKKSKKSCKGRMTAARKLSTVLSMGSEESNSSARTTLSFDNSDLTADRSTDASEVSGFVPGENILDPDLVRNPGVEETRLDLVDMEETGAHGHELDDSGEDKENESAEGDENFIMVDGERTPLKELIFMNGGAAIRYNPELETGETVESLKEAKILLDNIGVKGRRYSIEQDRRLSEENSFSSARVRLSECYIDLSGGGACLVAPLDQMVNISGAGSVSGSTQGGSGTPRGGNIEQQEKGQERRRDSSGKKRKLSTLRDVDLLNGEVAPKRSRKTGGSPSRMGRVRHSNVRHSDVRSFSHASRESLGERQMSENQKRINDRKSKAFVPAFIPFTPPSKAKKATEKSQRMPRSKAAAQLLEIDDDNDDVGVESEPSTSSLASTNDVVENDVESDDTKRNESDVNMKETLDSVELDQNMPDDDDSQNDDELDIIESPVITPKKKKKAKSNFSRTRLSEFEISPEYSSRSKSAEPSKVVPLTSEIDEDFEDILEKVGVSQSSKKSSTSGRNSPTEEITEKNIPPVGIEEGSSTAVSSLPQYIDGEPSLSPAKSPCDEDVSTSSKEVEPEPSKNSPVKGTVEIRKKAASESFKPAEPEITRRPRGRTTMVINYAEPADSPVVEPNKKVRSRNTSGKRGKSVDDSAKVNAETEEAVTAKGKKSRTKHNSGDKNSRKTGKRGGDELVATKEPEVALPDENLESTATNNDENARVSTEDNVDKKKESKSIESSSKTSDIPSQKEPIKDTFSRKQSKKDSTEAAPEEVKDEGRGRRRATSAISYKEPSIGKKLRQGDQHSASVYDDFVPQTKKGKKKK